MALVLDRGTDVGGTADLRSELLAAGFVIQRWGDGAKLLLSPFPQEELRRDPELLSPFEDARPL